MQNNSIEVVIKTNAILLRNEENNEINDMICEMAKETENKDLDRNLITTSINNLIDNPVFGKYFLLVDNNNKQFCGMNMVTYEYNIPKDKTLVWLQSVFIDSNYRNKGMFKKLLTANENEIKNDKYNKIQKLRLYMEKDNSVANAVYLKLGFYVVDEILYEMDHHFNDKKLNANNNESLKEETEDFEVLELNKQSLEKLSNDDSIWVDITINNSDTEINIKNFIKAFTKVLEDEKLGKVITIIDVSTIFNKNFRKKKLK